jgi:hypothetical protein
MPKGLRTFRFLVGKPGLTRFGGLSLFHLFCNTLGRRRFLQTHVEWPSYHHRAYHPVDLWLAHLVAIVAGIGRIENTQSLLHNGLIPPLLGLPDFPHRDTLRTFLWRFGSHELQSLVAAHDRVRIELFQRLGLRYDAVVDADTTALITYGHQEGVALGYIPKRRHRQGSYAPILSSEGRTGLSLGAELRAGNVPAVTGAWPFLVAQLDKLPSTIAASRTRVRLDGAFSDKDIIQPLDGRRVGYVIVAKMTQPLKDRMIAAPYHAFREGWEAAEFTYTPFHWNQAHRFVAVRRPVAYEPEEAQAHLFTFKRYIYHRALVTNLALTPEAVWRCYCDRAAQELLLREFKHAYHLAAIPTRSFWANAAYLELVLWAYDLVRVFQRLCLPPAYRYWNIATLRRELWWLPAEWVKRGSSNILWLPARYPHADLLDQVQRAISRVKPLI